jgi:threonine aldolase
MRYEFASDNTAGICPEAWEALAEANSGFVPSYGEDRWTAQAADMIREEFESDCEVFFVFNGTAANSLALASLCASYHSVIAHEWAHLETDECGATEFFSNGTKILLGRGEDAKLRPEEVERLVTRRSDIHFPKPRAVSVTQPTERGTLYRIDELRALRDVARRHGLRMHMDGARFANAVAALGATPAELSWKAGIDVLCLGGTKIGAALGDVVVFFDRELACEFDYRCKQSGQLGSKMRFLAASWVPMLRERLWLKYATHANEMAARLGEGLARLPGVHLLHPVEANAVFVEMPDRVHEELRARGWFYYTFIGERGARLMCSWATGEEAVDQLVRDAAGVA